MRSLFLAISSFLVIALAPSLTVADDGFGTRSLPTLTLPYGTWQAAEYNAPADVRDVFSSNYWIANLLVDICVPKHPLRSPANRESSLGETRSSPMFRLVFKTADGFVCTQSLSSALNQNGSQPAGSSPSPLLLSSLSVGNRSEGKTFNTFNLSESLNLMTVIHCLFLDVYVHSKALRPGAPKLPVIVWIYGGG
jgi:hypothetical protein